MNILIYSLNLVNEVFETDLPKNEYFHYYQLVHEHHTNKVIKGLHIAFIELPKFKPQNKADKKILDLWLRFLTEINEATVKVPDELMDNPLTKRAVALMEEASMTDAERYAYNKSIDNVLVEQALMREAHRKGEAVGMTKIVTNMVALGLDMTTICRLTGLTEEEIRQLKSTDQADSEGI